MEQGVQTSNVLALLALLVALAAFAVAFWQGWLTRQHNRLSVRPRLSFVVSFGDHALPFGVHLVNNGVGPAFITDFSIVVDGKVLSRPRYREWPEAWKTAGFAPPHACFHFFETGWAIPAGGDFALLTVPANPTGPREQSALIEAAKHLDLQVSYESAYEELYHVALAPYVKSYVTPIGAA